MKKTIVLILLSLGVALALAALAQPAGGPGGGPPSGVGGPPTPLPNPVGPPGGLPAGGAPQPTGQQPTQEGEPTTEGETTLVTVSGGIAIVIQDCAKVQVEGAPAPERSIDPYPDGTSQETALAGLGIIQQMLDAASTAFKQADPDNWSIAGDVIEDLNNYSDELGALGFTPEQIEEIINRVAVKGLQNAIETLSRAVLGGGQIRLVLAGQCEVRDGSVGVRFAGFGLEFNSILDFLDFLGIMDAEAALLEQEEKIKEQVQNYLITFENFLSIIGENCPCPQQAIGTEPAAGEGQQRPTEPTEEQLRFEEQQRILRSVHDLYQPEQKEPQPQKR